MSRVLEIEEVDAAAELAAKATGGPWVTDGDEVHADSEERREYGRDRIADASSVHDAIFIAASRELIPNLAHTVEHYKLAAEMWQAKAENLEASIRQVVAEKDQADAESAREIQKAYDRAGKAGVRMLELETEVLALKHLQFSHREYKKLRRNDGITQGILCDAGDVPTTQPNGVRALLESRNKERKRADAFREELTAWLELHGRLNLPSPPFAGLLSLPATKVNAE